MPRFLLPKLWAGQHPRKVWRSFQRVGAIRKGCARRLPSRLLPVADYDPQRCRWWAHQRRATPVRRAFEISVGPRTSGAEARPAALEDSRAGLARRLEELQQIDRSAIAAGPSISASAAPPPSS